MNESSGIAIALLLVLIFPGYQKAQQGTFAKVLYDNSGSAQAYSIIRSSDDKYMIAGERNGSALLIKMDQDGNILWQKKYGSAGYDGFNAIIETKDSCFVMTGYHTDFSSNTQYVLLVKVDSEGDTIWSRTINNGFWCIGMSVHQTNDDGFILTGFSYQTPGPSTIIIADKLDKDGNLTWSRTITCGTHHNSAYSVKQTPDSGYIIGGYYDSYSQTDSPALLVKLTPSGNVSWACKLPGYTYSCVSDIVMSGDGILCFLFSYQAIFMKIDFAGNVLWSRRNTSGGIYGGGEKPTPKLFKTSDNGFAYFDIYNLMKTDSSGNFLWAQNLFFYPADVVETGDHGFLALGNGPVWGVEMTETLNPQIGIIKTDSVGNSVACVLQSGGFSDTVTSVLVPVDVTTTNAGIQSVLPLLVSDAALSVDSGCVAYTGSIRETTMERAAIVVYPNPSDGLIHFETNLSNDAELKYIKIYNRTGQCIFQSFDPLASHQIIDLSAEPDGIYYVQVVFRDVICSQVFMIRH